MKNIRTHLPAKGFVGTRGWGDNVKNIFFFLIFLKQNIYVNTKNLFSYMFKGNFG